ncbi:MAG TPA: alpha/beta hydrolase [Frankiaceae bacterium]|nr:alpha/beta hydrolase [Frankiaceae bacterium]
MPAESDVLVPGPWTHRDVSANGTRFHVVESGSGPLVLLLHGFPQFWWCWRSQLGALPDFGLRAVAPDLRGYGASDKPPEGYDAYSLAADVAGLVRALGEQRAILVGHDWGAAIAWVVAALHPDVVERLVVLSTAHPLRHREAVFADPRGQLRASSYMVGAQKPWLAERALVKDRAARVVELLDAWSGPGWPTDDDRTVYREAMLIPGVAHSALEYYRWWVRAVARPTGVKFFKRIQQPITAPTLQLHGALDTCVLPRTALGSGRYVEAQYEWRLVDGVGHFLPEEAPDVVTGEITRWAK